MTTLTVQVVAGDEDGFITRADDDMGMQGGNVTTITTNAKVKVGQYSETGNLGSGYTPHTFTGWVHLKNLTIPQGATIDNAKLHFWHDASEMGDDVSMGDPDEGMTVAAEDVDSASKPTSYADVNGMTLTSASEETGSFIDADEGEDGEGMGTGSPNETFSDNWYPTHGTPGTGLEIKTIIQELVNRGHSGAAGNWASGNNINLKLTPTEHSGGADWHILWTDYDTVTAANVAPFAVGTESSMVLVIDYTAAAASTPTSEAFLLFID